MKYRIEKDGIHWAIAKVRVPQKGKQAGEEVWTQFKWYRTIGQAATGLQELLISENCDKVPELDTIAQTMKEVNQDVKKYLKELSI